MKSKLVLAGWVSTAAIAAGALLTASPAEASVRSKGIGGCISKLPLGATILGGTALAAGAGALLFRRTNCKNPTNDGGSFFSPESSGANDLSFGDGMDCD